MEYITNSEIETEKIALKLAERLKTNKVVALFGDLGSGKTVFVKGLACGLGIKTVITSPTFVFIKEYPIRKSQITNHKSQTYGNLVHVDCYRVKSEKDAEAIGLIDYLKQKDNIIAIEWPENIQSVLPADTIQINFENLGKNVRKILISPDNV